jgi:hypothetical protein
MTLIAWSLSAVLFDHARRPPSTPSSPALAYTHSLITLVVDRSQVVAESLVTAMLNETAAIWKPLGVDVRRGARDNSQSPAPIVHVIVTDDAVAGSAIDTRLGWIHFLAPNDPEPVIYLSRLAALQLLDSTSTLRQYPARRRDILVSRMLGRALAHELGHYLLESKGHASYGLMRSTWPLEVLIGDDRASFGLAPSEPIKTAKAHPKHSSTCSG